MVDAHKNDASPRPQKKRANDKFIYFQIKFESIREVYKKQQQPIFFF